MIFSKLHILGTIYLPLGLHVPVLLVIPLAFFIFYLTLRTLLFPRSAPSPQAPKCVSEDYPFVGAYSFWTHRWRFFCRAMASSATGNFSFFIGKHPIIGLSGDDSRKVFFESKQFGLSEGYGVLFGLFPTTKIPDEDGNDTFATVDFSTHFKKRITRMVEREVTQRNLPTLISDTRVRLEELAAKETHITNPFDSIYKLVYLLTTRTVGCIEIMRDRRLLDLTLGLYETISRSATAVVILFPWFPSINLIKRFFCGARLYFILHSIVKKRKASGAREADALQDMIDRGDETQHIIGVMMGALFAAQQNSGINVAWVLLHLASNPYWMAKVREEVEGVAKKYNADESVPLVDRVASLPLDAWETEFPTLELCLRDSIRLHALGACFRKNISGKDVTLGKGEVIPDQAFVTYHINDIHLNPSIYPDPLKWDPARYLPDRAEDKKTPMGYIGWGAGRHPCLGTKFAKLEQNIIVSLFLATFDFGLCNRHGNEVAEPPPIDLQCYSSWKPDQEIFLKYQVRA